MMSLTWSEIVGWGRGTYREEDVRVNQNRGLGNASSFTEHNIFKVNLCCIMYEYFTLLMAE